MAVGAVHAPDAAADANAKGGGPVAWRRVAVLGTGLIGGSLAAALRAHGLAGTLVGQGPEADEARSAGLVDEAFADATEAVRDAELVVLAAPPTVLPGLLATIAPALAAEAVVTDVASTKRAVVAAARDALGAAFPRFVAGHPIAGSERRGPGAANPALFAGARWVLCPEPDTDPAALARVEATLGAIGARTAAMGAAAHDEVFAAVSHLPHAVAFALADALAGRADADRLLDWAGAGLRDTTRIAASSGALWADILLDNVDAVRSAGRDFAAAWAAIDDALAAGDRSALAALIERGAAWRRRLR